MNVGRTAFEAYTRFAGDPRIWHAISERTQQAWSYAGFIIIGQITERVHLMTESGRIGYEAYARFTGGKTFDGRTMPTWDALPERIRDAWAVAASAVIAAHKGMPSADGFRPVQTPAERAASAADTPRHGLPRVDPDSIEPPAQHHDEIFPPRKPASEEPKK